MEKIQKSMVNEDLDEEQYGGHRTFNRFYSAYSLLHFFKFFFNKYIVLYCSFFGNFVRNKRDAMPDVKYIGTYPIHNVR